MRIHHIFRGLALLITIPAAAEAGDLLGRAVDMETEEPVELVTVTLLNEDGKTLSTTMTDETGRFRFKSVRGDTVGLALSRVAYTTRRLEAIKLQPEGDTEVTVELTPEAVIMAPIVVSASRRRETALGAPAAVSVLKPEDIQERQSFTPLDAISRVEGVQFTQKGLVSSSWTVRQGGNRVANEGFGVTGNLILEDWRNTRMPGFAFNLPYHLSSTMGDVDRVEVIRAPAGAMYGPDAGTAVIHVLTKSPFDHQGTTLSFAGGNQSLGEFWGRRSDLVSPRLGYTVSAHYLRGEDWKPQSGFGADTASRDIEQVNGRASVEWRPDDDTRLHLTAGRASALKLLEQFYTFYVEVDDFSQSFVQGRLHRRNLMLNLVYNVNGGTGAAVPFGSLLKDNSRLYSAQIQNGGNIQTGRVLNRFTYGVDLRTTNIRTDSTLTGRYEDNDTITEIGGFLQSTAIVSPKLDVFGALRVDYHDRVDDGVVLPFRLGASYKPSPSHSFRIVANQFKGVLSPSSIFQDFLAGVTPERIPYYSVGTPKNGWNFARDCGGGLCMRSGLVEGGVADYGSADATRTWGALQAQYPDLAGVAAPDAGQVGTQLKTFSLGSRSFQDTDPSAVVDLEQRNRDLRNQFEVGYTGFLGDRVSVDVLAYVMTGWNSLARSGVITPSVFFDQESLEAYLVGQGMADTTAATLAAELASKPVGTVTPKEMGASSDLVLSSGAVSGKQSLDTTWGVSVGATYRWPSGWQVQANYEQQKALRFGTSLQSYVPTSAGLLRVGYDPDRPGLRGSVEVRGQSDYYMNFRLWQGDVKGFVLTNVNLGYRFRSLPRMGLYLNVSNVFDHEHVEVVGGKVLGRLITGRIQLDL